ncbi:MAG: hypothetical protein ACTSX9_08900 [Candidatus Njordarchaeales archaeon]
MNKRLLALVTVIILLWSTQVAIISSQPLWDWKESKGTVGNVEVIIQQHSPIYIIKYANVRDYGYSVILKRLIEYIDMNGNKIYDSGDDILAQAPLVSKITWNIIVKNITIGNTSGLVITLEGSPLVTGRHQRGPPRTAHVVITSYLIKDTGKINGYFINGTNEIKVDIQIERWPWSSTKSYLALEIEVTCENKKVKTKHMQGIGSRNGEKAHKLTVEASGVPYNLTLWVNTDVLVNGEKKDILGTSILGNVLYVSYPRFEENIIHDPIISLSKLRETFYRFVPSEFRVLTYYLALAVFCGILVIYGIRRKMRKYTQAYS